MSGTVTYNFFGHSTRLDIPDHDGAAGETGKGTSVRGIGEFIDGVSIRSSEGGE